jgi:hypothetical protein
MRRRGVAGGLVAKQQDCTEDNMTWKVYVLTRFDYT